MKRVVSLRLIQELRLPLEAEALAPDRLSGLTLEEIYGQTVLYGNQLLPVGQFFQGELLQEPGEGERLVLAGDLSRVKRLGQGMGSGELVIRGSAGFHTGAEMAGGTLTVQGDAGDWLGAQMTGGRIVVLGNAGHWPGGAYRGNTQGMKGGEILIHGSAGRMAGTKMRGGVLAILGDCQEYPGYEMKAGTLLIAGNSGRHIGSGMVRGTILLLRDHPLLPTFYRNCAYLPPFWPILRASLEGKGVRLEGCGPRCFFDRYSGDALAGGKGEVLVCRAT